MTQVQLIGKNEFMAATLDAEHETFIIHIAVFSRGSSNKGHFSKRAQIAHLKVDEAPK